MWKTWKDLAGTWISYPIQTHEMNMPQTQFPWAPTIERNDVGARIRT